ncbi:ABC transporter permease [Cytobacillus sp. FJAT-54145]|uniref:ABC transporter permease n=1 Tax=Cytobacillus spartinae TaxID=3299023 RepID=A0ABW6KGA0_9BACI
MLNLIRNELLKIFRRPGTLVMIGLLILITTIAGGFIKYQEVKGSVPDNVNWKQGLELENTTLQKELEMDLPKAQETYIQRQLAINEYRIENNLSPNQTYSVWDFVKDNAQTIEFAGLFTIIIAGGIVASEFNWGTVKLLLIRPINRQKILLSKYATVIIFGILMLGMLFSYSTLLGYLLFGSPSTTVPHLVYTSGVVEEQNYIIYLIKYYGLNSINMLMLATMAFMISAAFRSSSLAIGLSIFLMFMGGQLTMLLSMRFDWAKYILFANTDLMQYFEGVPLVEGMTLTFSIIMLVLYFGLFQFLAHYIFKKRDVAA